MIPETIAVVALTIIFVGMMTMNDFFQVRKFRKGHWVKYKGMEWEKVSREKYIDALNAGEEAEFHGYW